MIKLFSLFLCFFTVNVSFAQNEALTAEIKHASISGQCEDGAIDLTITGGFSPFDIFWIYQADPLPNGLQPEPVEITPEAGNGGDIDGLSNGSYTAFVTDALCGTAEAEFVLKCECPECELVGEVESESCSSMDGSIAVILDCEEAINQNYTFIYGKT